jgi:DNA repair protein RecO
MNAHHTNFIILRKTPYHETSLIIAGISRQYGRIDLLVKGAKKISSKSLPSIDLFREIEITVNPKKEGLQAIYSAELISNFDNIAMRKNSYLDACEISKFTLRNSHPMVPTPLMYQAIKTAFQSLSNSGERLLSPLVKLVFLEEHGLLPELSPEQKSESKVLGELLSAAKGLSSFPSITPEYMRDIINWIEALCKYNDL